MKALQDIPRQTGRVNVSGAPDGMDGWITAMLAGIHAGGVVHVARDDARMMAVADVIRFFAPEADVLTFPAWDCLPYDRVSPNPEISSARIAALSRLAHESDAPHRIVLTTVNALLQRVPPRESLLQSSFVLTAGQEVDVEALQGFLGRGGYQRAGTVREPGEFATRGGLIDIFPPTLDLPIRLDLFGDVLEDIRRFDAVSQRSEGTLPSVALVPVGEIQLGEEAIKHFRQGYRTHFGAVTGDDPLYEAISEGRRHAGMEHWLPLFYETLESLLDYLPDAVVTLDHLADEACASRLTMIADYYDSRVKAAELVRPEGSDPYNPLPPSALYLDQDEWNALLTGRTTCAFTPFQLPGGEDTVPVFDAGGRKGREFSAERNQPDVNVYDALREHLGDLVRGKRRAVVAAYSAGARDRLMNVLHDHDVLDAVPVDTWAEVNRLPPSRIAVAVLGLEQGFETDAMAVIGEQDILGDRLVRPRKKNKSAENVIAEATQLSEGDLVVHVDHGIGRYAGLKTLEISGAPHDCVLLIYDGDDKLYVPVENIEVLSRYGSGDGQGQLDRLGGAGWQARKSKLKQRIREMADKLIAIAAAREMRRSERVTAAEGLYDEFCSRFPYHETDDQSRAIGDVLGDLSSGKPMDRLVCGDVGFGKTEVALRSAFVMAMHGKQVAIVAPTTLLCRQHFLTFTQRFAGLPIRIGQLSRLVGSKEQQSVRKGLQDGTVDIVIGTHALLGKSVSFRDLGLVIVDEEQHFGVAHKERLKELRSDVHVLTLTATPIPRTLQLALTGLRELSLIATPPVDRLAVRTYVTPFDPVIVREAILREHYRGGQTFYVCPRIKDLADVAEYLKEHIPEVKFTTAHGQMPPGQLDDVMNAFYDGKYDVLLSTNIIESGLDIPTANTMIVHRSDMFGLAQLYQLRGRIGRSKVRAYAYLTLPSGRILSENATKRLEVLQSLDSLGAGFSLASHDMDIRGAGNLLGEEQSGHIREVGFELYQEMLEEAVAAAKGETDAEDGKWSPQIGIGTSVLIPESYVEDLNIRMDLYRRIARLEDQDDIESFAGELIDRFGPLPDEVEHLLKIVAIKRYCRIAEVEKVDAGPRGATLSFRNDQFPNPAGMVEFISKQAGTSKLRPDHTLVYMRDWPQSDDRLKGVLFLLRNLAEVAQAA